MRRVVFAFLISLLACLRTIAQDNAVRDSVPNRIPQMTLATDSLSPKAKHYAHSLDSMKRGLNHQIDSLKKLKLPTAEYAHKLDSLNKINRLLVVQQQEAKLNAAERKVTGAVSGVEKKVNQKITSLTQEAKGEISIPNANIPGSNLNVPGSNLTVPGANLNVPNVSNALPNASPPQLNNPVNGMGDVQKDLGSISGLPQKEINEVKNIAGINGVQKEMGEAGQITNKASAYEKQISGVAKGDSASIAKLSKTAESEAKNVRGVKDLQKETQLIDNYKKMAGGMDNPDALEKQVKEQAVNHFAGKEKELQGAMGQISKLKQKYSSVTSLSNLPKRPPNEMHGKPLIERIAPGLSLQVLKVNNNTFVDVNPWIGYRLTGHFTAGAGWNERIGISHWQFSSLHVYGPRVFTEYKLIKGMTLRVEVETMNTYIPPNQIPLNADPTARRWVWNSFAGLKRNYTLFKHLKGNVQMLYNVSTLFGEHSVNIYGDPVTARIGFEFPMKKKK